MLGKPQGVLYVPMSDIVGAGHSWDSNLGSSGLDWMTADYGELVTCLLGFRLSGDRFVTVFIWLQKGFNACTTQRLKLILSLEKNKQLSTYPFLI